MTDRTTTTMEEGQEGAEASEAPLSPVEAACVQLEAIARVEAEAADAAPDTREGRLARAHQSHNVWASLAGSLRAGEWAGARQELQRLRAEALEEGLAATAIHLKRLDDAVAVMAQAAQEAP